MPQFVINSNGGKNNESDWQRVREKKTDKTV